MAFAGSPEDRLAIRELLETYADAVARNDAADWGATWSDDEPAWIFGGDGPGVRIDGKDQIVAAWRQRMARYAWISFRVSPGAIGIDRDRATARSYTMETLGLADGRRLQVFGRYDDDLVRVTAGWRFRMRHFTRVDPNDRKDG